MPLTRIHARIIRHPFAPLMQGGRLDSFYDTEQNLFLDVQGLQVTTSELFEQNGRLFERVTGNYIPLRLKFSSVSRLYCDDFFASLDDYRKDDPSRTIVHFFSWRLPERIDIHYRFGLQAPIEGLLHFFAGQVICEERKQPRQKITIERDWSPCPPMPERLVPRPQHLYRQFGGDPIAIEVNGKTHHYRLFIGELNVQPKRRPQVDAVLNLGEESSRWVKGNKLHPNDRSIDRGEGPAGMTISEIRQEANWVMERLEQNQRVLVHCVAGMNRSASVCCAVLILMEGLSAEAALERVRQHHPWARPDPHHWLALRWLEANQRDKKMKRILLFTVIGIVFLGLLIQLIPYGHIHTNPPVNAEPNWDGPETRALAQRACYDCHSNETRWPWYSNIAPRSWLIYHDVDEGRMHINFSDWNRADEQHACPHRRGKSCWMA